MLAKKAIALHRAARAARGARVGGPRRLRPPAGRAGGARMRRGLPRKRRPRGAPMRGQESRPAAPVRPAE